MITSEWEGEGCDLRGVLLSGSNVLSLDCSGSCMSVHFLKYVYLGTFLHMYLFDNKRDRSIYWKTSCEVYLDVYQKYVSVLMLSAAICFRVHV